MEVTDISLQSDTGETKNLQAEYPEKVKQLEQLLTDLVERGRSTPGPNLPNDFRDIDIRKTLIAEGKKEETSRLVAKRCDSSEHDRRASG